MNTMTLQIFSLIGVIVYFLLIVYFIKKKSLSLKYTLVWMLLGLAMLVLAICPKTLNNLSDLLGIASPVNALFAIMLFFVLMIMMSLTAILSKQSDRIRELVQYNALLEEKIRNIQRNLSEGNSNV